MRGTMSSLKNFAPISAIVADVNCIRRRTHVVFGVGNPNAKLDVCRRRLETGRRSLRRNLLSAAPGSYLPISLPRGWVLTARRCLHRQCSQVPSATKSQPEPDEVAACEPFLKKQIELVRPGKIIVALGKFAVQALTQSKVPITQLRGTWHTYMGIKIDAHSPTLPTCCAIRRTRNWSGKT